MIEKHWSLNELSKRLSVSRWTIKRHIDAGLLAAVFFGGRVLVPDSAIAKYLEVNRVQVPSGGSR